MVHTHVFRTERYSLYTPTSTRNMHVLKSIGESVIIRDISRALDERAQGIQDGGATRKQRVTAQRTEFVK